METAEERKDPTLPSSDAGERTDAAAAGLESGASNGARGERSGIGVRGGGGGAAMSAETPAPPGRATRAATSGEAVAARAAVAGPHTYQAVTPPPQKGCAAARGLRARTFAPMLELCQPRRGCQNERIYGAAEGPPLTPRFRLENKNLNRFKDVKGRGGRVDVSCGRR